MTLPKLIESPYFKPFTISGIYTLPQTALDIEDVSEVMATATLTTYEIVHLVSHTYKIFIEGHAHFKFNYSDPTPCSQIHTLTHTQPFSIYIPIEQHVCDLTFNLHPLVEDCYGVYLSPRTIYYNLTLITIASVSLTKGGGINEYSTLC